VSKRSARSAEDQAIISSLIARVEQLKTAQGEVLDSRARVAEAARELVRSVRSYWAAEPLTTLPPFHATIMEQVLREEEAAK
jgi:hypothetical protein